MLHRISGASSKRTRSSEVVRTTGGLDKREIYRRLGVPEIWIWRDGVVTVHALRDGAYVQIDQSAQLPGVDLKLLTSLLDRPTALQAVR